MTFDVNKSSWDSEFLEKLEERKRKKEKEVNIGAFPIVFLASENPNHVVESIDCSTAEKQDDLYRIFRPYLIFGRCLGVIPIQNLFQKDANKLRFRKLSLGVLISLLVISVSFLWLALSTLWMIRVKKNNPSEIANAVSPGIYCINGILIYSYFLWNGKAFIRLFQNWTRISFFFCKEDPSLPKDIAVVTTIMFTSGVMENVVLQLLQFPVFDRGHDVIRSFNLSENVPALEFYYYKEYSYLATYFPYSPYLTLLLFVCNKLILYSWNYTDIFITLVSRAFYYRFNHLIKVGRQKISDAKDLHDPIMWKSLIWDHGKLSDILEEFQTFLSPLIFLSYAVNTYYSCLQFHLLLSPSNKISLGLAIFGVWSFSQIMLRVLVVTISASRVYEGAIGILSILCKCPSDCYTPEVERVERSIQFGKKLTFHGLECFQITKSLYLSFLSVLLTFEIVLIQATGSSGIQTPSLH